MVVGIRQQVQQLHTKVSTGPSTGKVGKQSLAMR
jgi:hypothetical protein